MILGMHPYLVFNGDGQEAVKFYERALNAKVLSVQTFGEMPGNSQSHLPEEAKDLVLNAHLKVGNIDLMLSDTFPGQTYQLGSQVTVALLINDPEESREIFGKLADGGQVGMELQKTFWSPLYGQVTDKFGVTWQVSTETEDGM
jgi:PhnB protein